MVRPQPSPFPTPHVKQALCQDWLSASISSILYTLLLHTGHLGAALPPKDWFLEATVDAAGTGVVAFTVDTFEDTLPSLDALALAGTFVVAAGVVDFTEAVVAVDAAAVAEVAVDVAGVAVEDGVPVTGPPELMKEAAEAPPAAEAFCMDSFAARPMLPPLPRRSGGFSTLLADTLFDSTSLMV